MALNLPFKKDFFDTGPLIKPEQLFFLIISSALSNDFSINVFEIFVILFFEFYFLR